MIYHLSPALSDKDFTVLMNRFHFEKSDLPKLKALYQALLPLLSSKAYCEVKPFQENLPYEDYIASIITLGAGIDQLADLYLSHDQISEAYMLDCIGLELLAKAYEELVEKIELHSSLYVEKLSFLGDEHPMELLKELFERLSPEGMRLTDGLFLVPSKSASLILPLTSKAKKNAKDLCNTCASCNNLSCPSRKGPKKPLPKTYGNMQILHA